MNIIDPTGTDIYNFDENGNYTGKTEDIGIHHIAVNSYDKKGNHKVSYYLFADIINDPAAIESGEITSLKFLKESDIRNIMNEQQAFDPNLTSYAFIKASSSLSIDANYNFDYSTAILSGLFGGEKIGEEVRSKYLFIPEGDIVAHNLMNLGNYLWAATGYSLGISTPILLLGAHANSLGLFSIKNRDYNGYNPQLDSLDDQLSIFLGARRAKKKGYRRER